MPRTTDDLHIELIKTVGPSGATKPAGHRVSLRRDRSRSPKPAAPAAPMANVFPLKAVRDDLQPARDAVQPMPLLRIW